MSEGHADSIKERVVAIRMACNITVICSIINEQTVQLYRQAVISGAAVLGSAVLLDLQVMFLPLSHRP